MSKVNQSILSISLDPNIVDIHTDAYSRHVIYAKEFVHFVVMILDIQQNIKDKSKHYVFDNLVVSVLRSWIKYLLIPKAIYQAIILNSQYHFDAIVTQDQLATGLIGVICKWLFRKPLIVQLHGDDLDKLPFVFKIISKFVLSQTDTLRVVNPHIFNQLKQQFNSLKIAHIPLMVDVKYFYKPIQTKEQIHRFISVGRFIHSKRFDLVVQAFAKLQHFYPNIKLVMVGNGPTQKDVQELVNQRRLQKNIYFTGYLDKINLRQQYHNADVFIFASEHEGWGSVFVEAMASGLPIVTTNVGAVGSLVISDKNAKVSRVGDVENLAKGMQFFIKYPNQAYQYAKYGQDKVLSYFDSGKLKAQWIKLMKDSSKIVKKK